jgi:predicted RNA polymerase sigma factor
MNLRLVRCRGAARIADAEEVTLLTCCPSLATPSAVALTLRAVGGLTTAEIANAFQVPGAQIVPLLGAFGTIPAHSGAS